MNNTEYNADDIKILSMIKRKPFQVKNIDRYVTGGLVNLYAENGINLKGSIHRLIQAGFIRENKPKEYLIYFNKDVLKELLNDYPINSTGHTKDWLIEKASKYLSDNEIIAQKQYCGFYLITSSGEEILVKHKALLWFFEHKEYLFSSQAPNRQFNKYYFFNNPTIDPVKKMIPYFSTRNAEITCKLYILQENYNNAFKYAIEAWTNEFEKILKRSLRGTVNEFIIMQGIWIDGFQGMIETALSRVENQENLVNLEIEKNYNEKFEYKNIVSKDFFTELFYSYWDNDLTLIESNNEKLVKLLHEKYQPEKSVNEPIQTETDLHDALLDLLIPHLDLEILTELKDRIDSRIAKIKGNE